jgi:ligand-binding sensor domain-containing protein
MQKLTSFLLSFIFCWLSCNHAFANIRHLDTSNGLSNNEVTSFYQDIKGFVWVGTFDGLNRYDGYKFTTFRNSISDKNSLINNKVLCITQDQQYNLWVGTEGGVNRYDILNAKFYQINFMDPDNRKIQHIKGRVNMIKESASGSMAIASETEGFFMYNLKDSLARSIPLWLNNKAIYHYNAISLTVDLDKNIWVLVNGFGLCILDKQNNRLVLKENSLKSGNFILADGFKNIWIGTDKSLYKYTADGQLSLVTSDLKVIHLCIDHKNNLWIATDGQGIMILNTKTGNLENYEPKTQNRFLANPVIYMQISSCPFVKIARVTYGLALMETE